MRNDTAAQKKLLLLVDMQNGFMQANATRAVVKPVQALVTVWQERNWPIVASRFINLDGSNWERLRGWSELKDEPQTALIEELTDATSFVFKKSTYSAWSSEVMAVAASRSVRDIVLAGVDTNECVLATALSIFDSGFTPIVVEDCCASSGGEEPHAMAVQLMKACLGERQVVQASDI